MATCRLAKKKQNIMRETSFFSAILPYVFIVKRKKSKSSLLVITFAVEWPINDYPGTKSSSMDGQFSNTFGPINNNSMTKGRVLLYIGGSMAIFALFPHLRFSAEEFAQ